MTWISESSGMWFPHQVRALTDKLDEKIEQLERTIEMCVGAHGREEKKVEQLQCELVDARDAVTAAMLIGSDAMNEMRRILCEGIE